MKKGSILAIVVSLIFSCTSQKIKTERNDRFVDKDEIEILRTITNVYEHIVVDTNKTPDYTTIKNQFAPAARMGYLRNDSLILNSPDAYFDTMKKMLAQNEVTYLKEWEIKGETKFFGAIAQRTSMYGVYYNTKDSLAERGIINFQLIKLHDTWKILSMIWQAERTGLKISESYFN